MTMNSLYQRASFMRGAYTLPQAPPDTGSEVAFAGRSNAGKSTAINVITGIHALARVSKTPGRTQMINFFELEDDKRLVDLPGYGYAKVPEKIKRHWQHTLGEYLQLRQSLQGLILVMDCRHPLTVSDRRMLNWCHEAGLPVHVLLTKVDKLSRGAALAIRDKVHGSLIATYSGENRDLQADPAQIAAQNPTGSALGVQLFSGLTRAGVEEAQRRLTAWLTASTS